jgi:hypothetical protein
MEFAQSTPQRISWARLRLQKYSAAPSLRDGSKVIAIQA